MTPLGVLELIGLAGLVWWRGRVWWGKPLLLLTGSAYAYWLICLVLFSVSGHTALLQDTPRVIEPLLAAAGVLAMVGQPGHRPASGRGTVRPSLRRSPCACSPCGRW